MTRLLSRIVVEARRRGLLKVATAYLIVTWLVLEVGHTLFLVFHLPHGALQFVFVLLALGFPFVLLGTWQGWLGSAPSQTETGLDGAQGDVHHEGPWLAAVFGAVAVFAVAVAIGVRFFGMTDSGALAASHVQTAATHDVSSQADAASFNPPARSVAVLPFANLSGDPQQEYFSDGLTEELLNTLVRISELKVSARTSSFAFKGKEMDVGEIARKLNVAAILEGSVRRAGDQVRITVQLIDSKNGYHLWSRTYDRDLKNIFEVQSDIATNVVHELKATLLDSAASRRRPPNPEAYAAMLQGDYFRRRGFDAEAVAYYQRALQLDDQYAEPMLGLASVHIGLMYGTRKETDIIKARRLIERATAVDPNVAYAYMLQAHIARIYEFNWSAAQASLKRARELEPGNLAVLSEQANLAETLGHFQRAAELHRQVIARDPVDSSDYLHLGRVLMAAGEQEAAEASFRKALELDPQTYAGHYRMAVVQLFKGEPQKALVEAQLEVVDEYRLSALAIIYHALHRRADSDAMLRELTEKHAQHGAFLIAEAHAYRGEIDQALSWLERAYRSRDAGCARILSSPFLRPLVRDRRYQAFLRKLDLRT